MKLRYETRNRRQDMLIHSLKSSDEDYRSGYILLLHAKVEGSTVCSNRGQAARWGGEKREVERREEE
eukprot:747536-Hanusia_phi.AAC.1